jgi:hypothetical protein
VGAALRRLLVLLSVSRHRRSKAPGRAAAAAVGFRGGFRRSIGGGRLGVREEGWGGVGAPLRCAGGLGLL